MKAIKIVLMMLITLVTLNLSTPAQATLNFSALKKVTLKKVVNDLIGATIQRMPIMGPDKNGHCWQRNRSGGNPHKVMCPKS